MANPALRKAEKKVEVRRLAVKLGAICKQCRHRTTHSSWCQKIQQYAPEQHFCGWFEEKR